MKFRFAGFEFDDGTCELTKDGRPIPLQPQPSKVLSLLARRSGQIVTRAELQAQVWGDDTHVDFEQGLNWCIRRLREVLGDTATESKFIQTLPKRGYRFLVQTEEVEIPPSQPASRRRWTRWKAIAAAVATVAVIASAFVIKESSRQVHPAVTVLVLPFDNVSATQSGSEFQEIASDRMIAKLAEVDPRRLNVIDPMTARKFKNSKECIIELGNQLGADYVLVGEVNPSSEAVYVHAQLFKVSTNRQVWASEGHVPRNDGPAPLWDSMSQGVSSQLIRSTASND